MSRRALGTTIGPRPPFPAALARPPSPARPGSARLPKPTSPARDHTHNKLGDRSTLAIDAPAPTV